MLLGTPNVFSVDQRTTALLTNRLQKEGASFRDIQQALYLAALSQFCIYEPTESEGKQWPLRKGDPLHKVTFVKNKCTLKVCSLAKLHMCCVYYFVIYSLIYCCCIRTFIVHYELVTLWALGLMIMQIHCFI